MYKLHKDILTSTYCSVSKINNDGSIQSVPFDPANTDYQAYLKWLAEGNTPEPAPPPTPEPDWTAFNLAMIPPTAESTFEVWLGQFKEPYRAALAVASSEGNTERVQGQYEILKDLAPPTAEQIAEWQGIADRHNIGLTF